MITRHSAADVIPLNRLHERQITLEHGSTRDPKARRLILQITILIMHRESSIMNFVTEVDSNDLETTLKLLETR